MQIKDSFKPQETISSKGDATQALAHFKSKHSVQNQTKKKKNVKNLVGQNAGVWDSVQIKNYYTFLMKNQRVMQRPELIRKKKMFKKMSEFICTRNFSQCTSHHQKIMEKHGSVVNAIEYFKSFKINNYAIQQTKQVKKQNVQKDFENQDKNQVQVFIKNNEYLKQQSSKKCYEKEVDHGSDFREKVSAFRKFEQQQQIKLKGNEDLNNMIMMLNPNILNMMLMMMGRM